jgi:carbamoyl-phosphate synthase/aspartate carbamoyltransferase
MAVDLAIPLISNIKCAKLFVEAICRKYSFNTTEIDFKTTHKLVTFPGFLDIYSEWDEAKGIKFGLSSPVTSGISFSGIVSNHQVSHGMKFSNFMPYGRVGETLSESSMSVYMTTPLEPLDKLYGHMQSWVNPWPMVVELSGSELATVLYFVSLYGTPVHFTQVKTKCDLQLILMAKMKHLPVTCDVAVYNLFLSLDDNNGGRQGMERFLARRQDVEFLWENLECIDCLTSGKLISALEDKNTLLLDYSEIIGLLLTCVEDGRILYSELLNMIHENPKRIFHLHVSPGTLVTVEIDRPFVHSTGSNGNRSACFEHCTFGYVDKVVLEGKEVLYDGKSVPVDGSLQKRMQNLPALESLLPIKKAEVLGNANAGADDNLEARKVKAAVSILVPPKSPGMRAIGSIQQEKQNFLVQIESGQLQ